MRRYSCSAEKLWPRHPYELLAAQSASTGWELAGNLIDMGQFDLAVNVMEMQMRVEGSAW
jgi:hypothetical protein